MRNRIKKVFTPLDWVIHDSFIQHLTPIDIYHLIFKPLDWVFHDPFTPLLTPFKFTPFKFTPLKFTPLLTPFKLTMVNTAFHLHYFDLISILQNK
mgnify:CR=1 FL=1